ncbi:unnamed protein product [Arctogadus glacialis]
MGVLSCGAGLGLSSEDPLPTDPGGGLLTGGCEDPPPHGGDPPPHGAPLRTQGVVSSQEATAGGCEEPPPHGAPLRTQGVVSSQEAVRTLLPTQEAVRNLLPTVRTLLLSTVLL